VNNNLSFLLSNEEKEFYSTDTWLKNAAVQAKMPAHFSSAKIQKLFIFGCALKKWNC
jgi:hypothetical protein